MSDSNSNKAPLYTQKNVSLVSRAIQEFNKVNPKQPEENSKINSAADADTSFEKVVLQKGANIPKKRSVLGRGLSSLMSQTSVAVSVTGPAANASNPSLSASPNFGMPIVSRASITGTNLNSIERGVEKPFNTSINSTIPNSVIPKVESASKAVEVVAPQAASDQTANDKTSSAKLNTDHAAPENTELESLLFIPIDKLIPNPKQPRKEFSQAEIKELASSIRRSGLLQPILVRKNSNEKSILVPYEIIAGERRWRAAKEAGLIAVPAILKDLNDRETLEIGIIENVQRQDLNPLEEAEAYNALINDFGCSHEELSKIVSKDRSSITNTLRLMTLPPAVKKLVSERKISAGHARALLSLKDESEQIKLAEELISLKLSVRDVEDKIKEKKGLKKKVQTTSSNEEPVSDERNLALEERIRRVLGTKVKVSLSASGKGEVKISFFSRPEFETFLEKLGA